MDHLDAQSGRTPAPLRPCDLFSEDIHLLVDRELGAAESAVVEEHLQECPRCLALASQLERMSDVLRAWDLRENDQPAPEARLQRAVLGRVLEQSTRRRRDDRFVRSRHLATAAVVVLGLGLGVVLGLGDGRAPAAAPVVVVSDAPWPLEARTPLTYDLPSGPIEDRLTAADLLAGVTRPTFAESTSGESELGPLPEWNADLFRASVPEDGLPLLVTRFQRQEAFESRFGERALYWMGPKLDETPRLVTENVYRFLEERAWLASWRHRSIHTSPSVASRPDPLAPDQSTGMTAREMVRPMVGVQERVDLSPEARLAGVSVATNAGAQPKGHKAPAYVAALSAWPLRDPVSAVPGLRSGPLGEAPRRFLDPLAAWGNEQLRLAESQHDAGMIVAFVKDTTEPIYLPAGHLISGGLADRIVAQPTWLPASQGTATYPIRCFVVQGMPREETSGAPQLTPYVVGPTLRALLASGASQAQVKAAAQRMVAAWMGTFGVEIDVWNWSLRPFYESNAGPQVAAQHDHIKWGDADGFVVGDGLGRILGFELVRAQGSSARELLKRLWLGYVVDGSWRIQNEATREAFVAPAGEIQQALRKLSVHDGHFRISRDANAPHGTRVSHLEIEAAGLGLHALEVGGVPTVVSGLSTAR